MSHKITIEIKEFTQLVAFKFSWWAKTGAKLIWANISNTMYTPNSNPTTKILNQPTTKEERPPLILNY